MKALVPALVLGLLAWAVAPARAESPQYPADGYIAVFGDAAGTDCCVDLPPGIATTLHVIAVTGGQSASGLTGAEFRIEVWPPDLGALLAFTPSPNANVTLGNPIDNSSAPGDGSGLNLAFPTCQKQAGAAGDHIELGTLLAYNVTGEHELRVKKHNHPSSPAMTAPLLVLCDAPVYTLVPLTLLDGDAALVGQEPMSFRTLVNSASCSGASCGAVSVQDRSWSAMKDLYR